MVERLNVQRIHHRREVGGRDVVGLIVSGKPVQKTFRRATHMHDLAPLIGQNEAKYGSSLEHSDLISLA